VTGSDVSQVTSHVTGRGPIRKLSRAYAQPEVAQPFPAFFLTLVVVQNVKEVPWIPVTEGHVTPSGMVCACATGGCATGSWLQEVTSVTFPRFFLSTRGCSLRRPRLALVIYPFYFHFTGSHFIFI